MATALVPGTIRERQRRSLAGGVAAGVVAVVVAFGGLSLGSTLAKSAGAPGTIVALWRFAVGALLWHAIVAWRGRIRGARGASRFALAGWAAWRAALLPGVAFGVNLSCFFSGVERTPVAHAEFISACAPLLLVPFGAWRLGERVPRAAVAAAAVALAGVSLILAAGSSVPTSLGGDGLIVVSVLAWAVYLTLAKSARRRVGTAEFMAVTTTAAGVTTFVIALATSGAGDLLALDAHGWFVVAVLAVTSGVVSHGLITWAQQRVAVSTVSMLQLAQPALGALWAAVFLGESVGPPQLLGMALVVAAVAVIAGRTARRAT